jgi:hypothetical protein
MNKLIRKEFDQRFLEIQEETSQSRAERHLKHSGEKSVVTLAIEAYMAENKESDLVQRPKLENHFAQYATYQIRLFLFAGNDTISSTIVYVYHLLSQHPEALEKVRQEHNSVFGPDIDNAAEILVHSPALLNQCRYTQAVIKETLRLFPPSCNHASRTARRHYQRPLWESVSNGFCGSYDLAPSGTLKPAPMAPARQIPAGPLSCRARP